MFSLPRRIVTSLGVRRGHFCSRSFAIQGKRAVLGIETSCDDTCAAIVLEDGSIIGSSQKSQHQENQQKGGVVPSVAAQNHRRNLPIVVRDVLQHASVDSVDAVALTIGPGLAPCLGAGLDFCKQFCSEFHKPLIPVHHMEAHAMAPTRTSCVFYPSLSFLISGGHTQLLYCSDHLHPFLEVGSSLDDACGECIDKVVREILRFAPFAQTPKHGGAQLSEWSMHYQKQSAETPRGNDFPAFPLPLARRSSADFSFAGLKTHSIRVIHDLHAANKLDEPTIERFAFEFERAVVRHLLNKLQRACHALPEVRSLVSLKGMRDS